MKVLIAYTTKKGSTREVAEKIGRVLESRGMEVKVADIKDKPKPEGFDAAVVGAPVMMGNILHRAPRFVKKHLDYLKDRPFACFALGGTLAEDNGQDQAG
jgi:menaquinone-dependent protoporphyrinogen oxidase